MKRFAIIIESSDVQGKDDLPGARLDAQNWERFLKSDLGGAWSGNEILVLNKPSSWLVKARLEEHADDYVFLAFSGHGKEDPYTHIIKACLNDVEKYVPVDDISPKAFGTSVFDCCRCFDSSGRMVTATCFDSMEGIQQNKIALANARQSPIMEARIAAVLRSQRHRTSFLTALDEKKSRLYANLDPVRMFACASDESAMDGDEKAGGYYTTFLIESAEVWGRQAHGVYSTKKAHDDACVRMAKKNPQQHPQYVPLWQAYPFAVSV